MKTIHTSLMFLAIAAYAFAADTGGSFGGSEQLPPPGGTLDEGDIQNAQKEPEDEATRRGKLVTRAQELGIAIPEYPATPEGLSKCADELERLIKEKEEEGGGQPEAEAEQQQQPESEGEGEGESEV